MTLSALRTCNPFLLKHELDFITSVFLENGYQREIKKSVKQLKWKKGKKFWPEICPVYLKLPYISSSSIWFRIANLFDIQSCKSLDIPVRDLFWFSRPKYLSAWVTTSYPRSQSKIRKCLSFKVLKLENE